MIKIKFSIQEFISTWVSARIVVSNWKYFHLNNEGYIMRFSQIKGVGVGLASQISFHPPLKRFDGFILRIIEWAFF